MKDVEPIIKIVEVDGQDLVKDYSDEIERMLGSKMKSVMFDYYNSMMINTADEDGNYVDLGGEFPLEENEHFNKLPVNTQMSNIQVPTNVHNKDPNILNAIYNTEALNDIFIGNFQKDPTLTWQYFGSSTGFFRIYPGIKWTPDSNGVVAFDCRNRNWYIQAATSPKDIIIMVDISGSMKGLKMTIAKHTINTILDTLGENDFVNVIAYTDYVRYVEPCFRGTLVQADLDNREHFKVLVEELHVKGEAKIKNAMKESFKILNEVSGSMCNQAIMLITDGAMEDFQSVFEEFNWPERRVRVFTYLIGREMTFAQNTKWIACNNKGYYTHIATLADVQENVMEYLHVLSRPMVINHDHDIIWTEAYMDTVLFTTKAQSLLLMTSVAMPVFSKKKETLSHGILLGVVGSDIPLMEVMKLAPRYMYKDGKKLKPKPNYNSVDLSEVEWEDTDELLRTAMVKGETGTLSLNIRASVDKGKRPLYLTNEYFYTNIDNTPFSFGMALTKGHGKLMFMGNVSVEEGEVSHNCPQHRLEIVTYCETDIDPDHRKYSQLQAAIRYLLGKEPDLECDEVLLSQTLFDAVVTAPLEAYWNTLMLNDRVEPGVETAFLGTRSGLMRPRSEFQSKMLSEDDCSLCRKFLTPADKDNLFTIDHFPLWYRLAVENTPGKFYYYPVNDKGLFSILPCVCLNAARVSVCFLFLAVGLQMSLDWLEKRFWAIAKQVTAGLTFTQTHIIGRFFGEVDGSIMASLLKMGIFLFSRVSLFDYQAMCKTGHHHASSARPLLSVSAFLSLTRCFCVSVRFLLDFNLCGLWHSDYFVDAHKQKKLDALQPCDTAYPGFMYDPSVREANSLNKCGRCQKMFVVQQIPDSNLVLVVTQAYCDCSRQYGAILLEPKEIKYILHILSSKMLPPAGCLQPQILQGGQDCIQPGKSHLCCNLLIFPQISDAVHWHSTANDENINRLSEQSHNICLLLAEALKLQIYVMLCFYKISSPLYIYFTASFQFSLISVNITPQ
uniref:Calcium voltage-gated channel auxiliary subunit alpha2delta 4 n=1 Tax=Maylandia zebra TaxID=106582 RepID=A0A3P9CH50_9CICH